MHLINGRILTTFMLDCTSLHNIDIAVAHSSLIVPNPVHPSFTSPRSRNFDIAVAHSSLIVPNPFTLHSPLRIAKTLIAFVAHSSLIVLLSITL